MKMPKKSLIIKVAIAIAIVLISLILLVSLAKPKGASSYLTSVPSLIPATEGFEGDDLPEYEDVEYYVSEDDTQS